MPVLALVSAYLDGPLTNTAIRSVQPHVDHVLVFEGPAGAPLDAAVPETDYTIWDEVPNVTVKHGRWRTDAKKRTAMVEASRKFERPTWSLWLDSDELLVNGETLADWTRYFSWLDAIDKESDPEALDRMGWPIRLVELDGSVALCRGKVVRVDLIDSYSVSSSVFKNALGFTHGEGNVPEKLSQNDERPGFGKALEVAFSLDRMVIPSWLVAEPFLVHRSLLRHPRRQPLRMHAQEAVEIEKGKRRSKIEDWAM